MVPKSKQHNTQSTSPWWCHLYAHKAHAHYEPSWTPTKLVTWPHNWHVSTGRELPDVRMRSPRVHSVHRLSKPATSCADVFAFGVHVLPQPLIVCVTTAYTYTNYSVAKQPNSSHTPKPNGVFIRFEWRWFISHLTFFQSVCLPVPVISGKSNRVVNLWVNRRRPSRISVGLYI